MKINKFINFIIASALLLGSSFNTLADNKPFYTSKSNKKGVSGDINIITGDERNYFVNPIEVETELPETKKGWSEDEINIIQNSLNEERVGNKILNFLFLNDSLCFDESLTILSERVGKNVSKRDLESKKAGLTITEGVSNKELMEILSNNYIILSKGNYWITFRVDITELVLSDVYEAWDYSTSTIDNPIYDRINVNVVFDSKGEHISNSENAATTVLGIGAGVLGDEEGNKFTGAIGVIGKGLSENNTNTGLGNITGQLLSRNPCTASLGTNQGAKDKMRVDIYRQFQEKNGKYTSKKISSARIGAIFPDSCRLYFIAGTKGSVENGDIVVPHSDYRSGVSLTANWMKGAAGLSAEYDYTFGNNRYGLETVGLVRAGIATTKDRHTNVIDGIKCKPMTILDLGIGVGIRHNLIGRFSVMPYVMGQWESAKFSEKKPNDAPEDYEAFSKTFKYLRFPLGVKFSINISYPVQLMFGAEYVLVYDVLVYDVLGKVDNIVSNITGEKTIEQNEFEFVNDNIYKNIGVKRDGLSLYAGIRIAF